MLHIYVKRRSAPVSAGELKGAGVTRSRGRLRQSRVRLVYPGYRGDLRIAQPVNHRELVAGTEAVMATRREPASGVPVWIEPMLATPDGGRLPSGPEWAYEYKLDGTPQVR